MAIGSTVNVGANVAGIAEYFGEGDADTLDLDQLARTNVVLPPVADVALSFSRYFAQGTTASSNATDSAKTPRSAATAPLAAPLADGPGIFTPMPHKVDITQRTNHAATNISETTTADIARTFSVAQRPSPIAFRTVWGSGALASGHSKTGLTLHEFQQLCMRSVQMKQDSSKPTLRVENKNTHSVQIDFDYIDRVAPEIANNLGLSERTVRARLKRSGQVRVRYQPIPEAPKTKTDTRIIAALTFDLQTQGVDKEHARTIAEKRPEIHIPVQITEDVITPTYFDARRYNILKDYYQNACGYSVQDAKKLAKQDPRAFTRHDTRPVYIRDQQRLHEVTQALVQRGVSVEKAMETAYWHPSVITSMQLPPTPKGLHYALDSALVGEFVRRKFATEHVQQHLQRRTAEFRKEGLTHSDARAAATKEIQAQLRQEAEENPLCESRREYRHISPYGHEVTLSLEKDKTLLPEALYLAGRKHDIETYKRIIMDAAQSFARYLEDNAAVIRVGNGKKGRGKHMQGSDSDYVTGKLFIMPTMQYSARKTAKSAERPHQADPNVHVHFLVAPIGLHWNAETQQYEAKAIDERDLKRKLAVATDIFDAEVERRLAQELGIHIEHTLDKNGNAKSRIPGVSKDAMDYFSTGREQAEEVLADLEKLGPVSDVDVRKRLRQNRFEKDEFTKKLDQQLQPKVYIDSLRQAGISLGDLEQVFVAPEKLRSLAEREDLLREALYGSAGICKDSTIVPTDDIAPHLARCNKMLGAQSLTLDELYTFRDRFLHELIPLRDLDNPDVITSYTTHIALTKQAETAQYFESAHLQRVRPIPTEFVDAAIAALATGKRPIRLHEKQELGVRTLCGTHRVVAITGHAGTGKTTLLRTAIRAMTTVGEDGTPPPIRRVTSVSVAGKRALLTGLGIQADASTTVESLIHQHTLHPRTKQFTKEDLVVIDEGAFFDNDRWHQLQQHLGEARIFIVGDRMQQDPVGAQGPYDRICDIVPVVDLDNVQRPRDIDGPVGTQRTIAEQKHLRAGHADTTLRSLDKRGRLHIAEHASDQIALALDKFTELLDQPPSADGAAASLDTIRVIIDTSHKETHKFNRLLQARLHERGLIGDAGFKLRSSETQLQCTIHEQDRVRVCANMEDLDGNPILNGTTAVVESLDCNTGIADLRTFGGEMHRVQLHHNAPRQPFRLAYADHPAAIQGDEADNVLWLVSPKTDLKVAYVAATRAVRLLHAFICDDDTTLTKHDLIDKIAEQLSRFRPNLTSLDVLEATDPERYAQYMATAANTAGARQRIAKASSAPSVTPTFDDLLKALQAAACPPRVVAALSHARCREQLLLHLNSTCASTEDQVERLRIVMNRSRLPDKIDDIAALFLHRLKTVPLPEILVNTDHAPPLPSGARPAPGQQPLHRPPSRDDATRPESARPTPVRPEVARLRSGDSLSRLPISVDALDGKTVSESRTSRAKMPNIAEPPPISLYNQPPSSLYEEPPPDEFEVLPPDPHFGPP